MPYPTTTADDDKFTTTEVGTKISTRDTYAEVTEMNNTVTSATFAVTKSPTLLPPVTMVKTSTQLTTQKTYQQEETPTTREPSMETTSKTTRTNGPKRTSDSVKSGNLIYIYIYIYIYIPHYVCIY